MSEAALTDSTTAQADTEEIGVSSAASTTFKERCDSCRSSCNRTCNGTPLANAYCDQARVSCARACFRTLDCQIAYPNVRSGGDEEGASE